MSNIRILYGFEPLYTNDDFVCMTLVNKQSQMLLLV